MAKATIDTHYVDANGQRLFVRTVGNPMRPPLLFLHGFPEFGGAWDAILPHYADRFFAIAPDQRGYNLSSKPSGVEDYKANLLAADMLALCEQLAPGRPINLVGHDWGASVAYMMAFMQPHRVARLVVLNGVHPIPFQRAIYNDPDQRAASQYIRFLRRNDSAELLLAEDCKRPLGMLAGEFGGGSWLTDDLKLQYRAAYQQPGAMAAMVNWYKATPLVVPAAADPTPVDRTLGLPLDALRVRMPHLVIWGMRDRALLASSRAGLEAFCDDLDVVEVADADHWIVHQQPAVVMGLLDRFFSLA